MKFLGIIPARGGSKGIPNKNIKQILHKPLIAYTIEAGLNSKLHKIIVSSENTKIKSISKSYGAEIIDRPKWLAQDDTPTLPVLQHVIEQLTDVYNAVLILQPTSPLRTAQHINESIELFQNSDADSLVSVTKVPHNFTPDSLMKLEKGYLTDYIPSEKKTFRRQEKSIYYARNGAAIYITKTELLNTCILGGKILPYFMNKIESIDIDDMEDFRLVEAILKYNHAI